MLVISSLFSSPFLPLFISIQRVFLFNLKAKYISSFMDGTRSAIFSKSVVMLMNLKENQWPCARISLLLVQAILIIRNEKAERNTRNKIDFEEFPTGH